MSDFELDFYNYDGEGYEGEESDSPLVVQESSATPGALYVGVGDSQFWLTYEASTHLLTDLGDFLRDRTPPPVSDSSLEGRVAALERSLADIRENGLRL